MPSAVSVWGVTVRLAQRFCGLVIASVLALPVAAGAKQVTFKSASPYQLGDLLGASDERYELAITADLVYPEVTKAKMPAFVFMHGSGGKLLRHQRYLELARGLGFVTLQIDSFGPRGTGSTVGNQRNVTAAMMTTDVLRALRYLAEQPNIEPGKIVLMGSSKGAIAALFATWAPIRRKIVGDLDFAAYILLYPLCAAIEDANVTTNPVHIFIGEKDNWTPAAPCIKQVDRMKRLGRNWAITLYEGAYHGFDSASNRIRHLPHAYSMAGCNIALRADGYEYETGSGHLLTKAERLKAFRSCARKGSVRIGGSSASDTLLKDIRAILKPLSD